MQMKSGFRLVGVAVSVAALLGTAACGSGGDSGGSDGKTLTFGLSTILSGPYAAYGEVGQGVEAYFKQINAAGGVNGYKLKLDSKDNAYQANQSVAINRQFTAAGHLGIFELGTPATQAALRSKSSDVPLLCAANGDLFTPPEVSSAYTVDPEFSRIGLFEADFIMENLKQNKYAFAYENDDLGTPALKVVPGYVKDKGGELLAEVPIDAAATDFSSAAARLKSSGATIVQALVGTAAFAGLQKAADAIGYHPKWVTFFTQMNAAYPGLVGDLAEGVYADNFLLNSGAGFDKFSASMKKYYPKVGTSQFAQLGWSLAAFTVDGLKIASDGGKKPTRSSLVKALDTLENHPSGLLPSVTFNDESHVAGTQSAMFQYVDGAPKQVTKFEDLPTTN
jgi:branched-chain amino acid transport system substrate-binding protein